MLRFVPSDAAKHARQSLDHWQAGRLPEAEALYRLAIGESADEPHHEVSSYHTQLGQVLALLGNDAEAEQHLRRAIDVACTDSEVSSNIVGIARYFCAEFYVSRRPAEALAIVAPALTNARSVLAILHFVHAKALWALGRLDEAHTAADKALSRARSDEQRERMRQQLGELPGWNGREGGGP